MGKKYEQSFTDPESIVYLYARATRFRSTRTGRIYFQLGGKGDWMPANQWKDLVEAVYNNKRRKIFWDALRALWEEK